MNVAYLRVVDDGILVVGAGGLPQEFWFATASGS
jgi:hypothetical protein